MTIKAFTYYLRFVALLSFLPTNAQVDIKQDFGTPSYNPDVLQSLERGYLFGIDNSGSLFRIDPTTGLSQLVGSTGFSPSFDCAVISDGRMFAVSGSNLYEVNPRDASATFIGNTGYSINAMAANDFALYAATANGDFLIVDIETGAAGCIGSFGNGLGSSGDLAFDEQGKLFAVVNELPCCDPALLATIDPTNGEATVIGPIGFSSVYGLSFQAGGELNAIANGNRFQTPILLSVDKNTGQGTEIATIPGASGMGGLAGNKRRTVFVPFEVTIEDPACHLSPGWNFCQHRSGSHVAGGGLLGADDTYAWDINLWEEENQNADAGKPVFPLSSGKVVNFGGLISPEDNNYGAVLIEHAPNGVSCETNPEECWWSSYLHLDNVDVVAGQIVDEQTFLGTIGSRSPSEISEHLHLAVYEGVNEPNGLVSIDIFFYESRYFVAISQWPETNLLEILPLVKPPIKTCP